MAFVDIIINSKSYRIGCVDGEEDKIKQYARDLNQRIRLFQESNTELGNSLSNESLLLLQSLMLLEDLENGVSKDENIDLIDDKTIIEVNEKIEEIEKSLEKIEKLVIK